MAEAVLKLPKFTKADWHIGIPIMTGFCSGKV